MRCVTPSTCSSSREVVGSAGHRDSGSSHHAVEFTGQVTGRGFVAGHSKGMYADSVAVYTVPIAVCARAGREMVAMPQRQYSAVIIGPSWPLTEPSKFFGLSHRAIRSLPAEKTS
jgi:hypothetical protein